MKLLLSSLVLQKQCIKLYITKTGDTMVVDTAAHCFKSCNECPVKEKETGNKFCSNRTDGRIEKQIYRQREEI